jgi:hypothetical protein
MPEIGTSGSNFMQSEIDRWTPIITRLLGAK